MFDAAPFRAERPDQRVSLFSSHANCGKGLAGRGQSRWLTLIHGGFQVARRTRIMDAWTGIWDDGRLNLGARALMFSSVLEWFGSSA
jgi:hypothetical protein